MSSPIPCTVSPLDVADSWLSMSLLHYPEKILRLRNQCNHKSFLFTRNKCSPGLLSMVQCWQHKHGRILPFSSYYVIHFSCGQITEQFQMFKLELEKAEKPEIKLPTSVGSSEKQKSSRKTSISALWSMPKALTVWITTNCRKFLKRRWKYQTT